MGTKATLKMTKQTWNECSSCMAYFSSKLTMERPHFLKWDDKSLTVGAVLSQAFCHLQPKAFSQTQGSLWRRRRRWAISNSPGGVGWKCSVGVGSVYRAGHTMGLMHEAASRSSGARPRDSLCFMFKSLDIISLTIEELWDIPKLWRETIKCVF